MKSAPPSAALVRPFRKVAVAQPIFPGNERAYVAECLDTTWISSAGPFIPRFETAFASFCGVEHAVACNSGTSALHLAMLAFDVAPGDEVLVPSLSFVAT